MKQLFSVRLISASISIAVAVAAYLLLPLLAPGKATDSSPATVESIIAEQRETIAKLREDFARVGELVNQLTLSNKELVESVNRLREEVAALKERVALAAKGGADVAPVTATVNGIAKEETVIAVDKGVGDGMKEGMIFNIQRAGTRVAKIQILQVYDTFSSATVLYLEKDQKIQVGDIATLEQR